MRAKVQRGTKQHHRQASLSFKLCVLAGFRHCLILLLDDFPVDVTTRTDGVIYARHNLRWATSGMEICRVAGATPIRSGNLLSP